MTPGEHGTIWEIASLGGEPRRLAPALSGGDLSHDGKRVALFRFDGTQIALVVITRDGSAPEQVKRMPLNSAYDYPRCSPDDRWIAFQRDSQPAFDMRILVVPTDRNDDPREIAHGAEFERPFVAAGRLRSYLQFLCGSTVLTRRSTIFARLSATARVTGS